MRDAPAWLTELQARFGEAIRTPLDRATGTLTATPARYPVEAVRAAGGAEARLAVYNRQYWFRLFTVLQTVFPLTVHLLGAWDFNDYAARFLLAHPPTSWDLERVPEGFEAFFARELGAHPRAEVLSSAARLDAAWRALLREGPAVSFGPRAEDAARLADARLVPSPSVLLWEERWALLERKVALVGPRDDEPAAPPPRHDAPRWWCLRREQGGVRHLPLEPGEGALLALLRERTVRDALAVMEASSDAAQRASLPAKTQRWLARGVERGVWRAVDFGDQRRTQV